MKFLVSSDWHLRDDKPRCRIDENWMETQEQALTWLVELMNEQECSMIVAGDLLDSGSNSQALENMIIRVLKKANYPIYTIPGNHDLHYHSINHLYKSTYWVLHQANVIVDIASNPIDGITAVPYGVEIPNKEDTLVCHRLVFPSTPPSYLINAYSAQEMLTKYDYDVILSGDNHQSFYYEQDGKILINSGGLLVQSADKKFSPPKVYMYDDYNKNITEFEVPHNSDMVVQKYLLDEKEREIRINAFVEQVKVVNNIGLSFKENIDKTLNETNISKEAEEILYRALKGELYV